MGVGHMQMWDSEKASKQERLFEILDSSYLLRYPFECLGRLSLIFCQNEFPCPHTQIFWAALPSLYFSLF